MKRVIRTLEYIGTDEWIETTMNKSLVKEGNPFECDYGKIKEISRKVKTIEIEIEKLEIK